MTINPSRVNVLIKLKGKKPVNKAWIQCISNILLDSLFPDKRVYFDLVITDNNTIQRLNKKYRGINEPTDVLSFHMFSTLKEIIKKIRTDSTVPLYLGEIVISIEKVTQQAEDYGNTADKELAILIIHGLLHLIGYDHIENKEYAKMHNQEIKLLKLINHLIPQIIT